MPSREAVIKRVTKGGTRSVKQLRKQLGYLSRQGNPDRENIVLMGSARHQNDPDNPGQPIANAVDPNNIRAFAQHVYQRSGRLPGDQPDARLNHDLTIHFVISFPRGTNFDAAERTGRDWAEHVFGHGYTHAEHGVRKYDYVTAFHRHEDDVDHPHMHVVVDRSPVGGGNLLRIERGHPHFSYEAMRLAAVDAAANHNVVLTVTPPEERTAMPPPISDAEYRRRQRDARRLAYSDAHYDEHGFGPEDDDSDSDSDDDNGGPANRDRGDRTSRDLARGCTPVLDPRDGEDGSDFSDDGDDAMGRDDGAGADVDMDGVDRDDVPFEDDQAAIDQQIAAEIAHQNQGEPVRSRPPSDAGRDDNADLYNDDNADLYNSPEEDDQAAIDRQLAAEAMPRNPRANSQSRSPTPPGEGDREIDPLQTQSREPFQLDDDDDDDDDAPHPGDDGTGGQAGNERILRVQPDRRGKRKRTEDTPGHNSKRPRREAATAGPSGSSSAPAPVNAVAPVNDGNLRRATRSAAPAADTPPLSRKRRHVDDRQDNANKRARRAGPLNPPQAPTTAPASGVRTRAQTQAQAIPQPGSGANPGANTGASSRAPAADLARAAAVDVQAGPSNSRANGAGQRQGSGIQGSGVQGSGAQGASGAASRAGRSGNARPNRQETAASQRLQALEALRAHRRQAALRTAPLTARQQQIFREQERALLRQARQALTEERRANHGNMTVTTRAAERARNPDQAAPAADAATAPEIHERQPAGSRERGPRPGRGRE